jgi:hypothetical protein
MDENRVAEEQIEEDIELFGRRPAPLDPDEGLPHLLRVQQNQFYELVDESRMEIDPPITSAAYGHLMASLRASDVINTEQARHSVPPKTPTNASTFALQTRAVPSHDVIPTRDQLERKFSDTEQARSPLLNWLDQTAPPQYPTKVHNRRQEQMNIRTEAKTHELEEIEILRNVLVTPALQTDRDTLRHETETNGESELPLGARIYYRNIVDRFPQAPKYLATRLSEANWVRANRLGFAKFPVFNDNDLDLSDFQEELESDMSEESSSSDITKSNWEHKPSFDTKRSRVFTFEDSENSMKDKSPPQSPSHVKKTTGSKRTCSVCNKSFRRLKQLRRHQKKLHSLTGQFKCPDCSLAFEGEEICERHWHFEHSKVVYSCPECLRKLDTSALLSKHIQRAHPNSVYALFGARFTSDMTGTSHSDVDPISRWRAPSLDSIAADDYNISELLKMLDSGKDRERLAHSPELRTSSSEFQEMRDGDDALHRNAINSSDSPPRAPTTPNSPQPFDGETKEGYKLHVSQNQRSSYDRNSSVHSRTLDQLDGLVSQDPRDTSLKPDGNWKYCVNCFYLSEFPKQDLEGYLLCDFCGMHMNYLSPRRQPQQRIDEGSSNARGHHHRLSACRRSASRSSIDYWSGSHRHSRAGSAASSKNDSLHGYNIYDPKEQDMNPLVSAPHSHRSSAGGSDVSMSRLPHPPVRLGSKPSFKCDICGQTIWVTRKRDWK